MEKLSLHIEYLLLHHDCVIIPDLGAFISIYKAPAFDYDKGILTPPSKEIRFNQALRSDDGLLANSYARKYCIPYREGSEMLAKTVAELGATLANEGEITFGRIGILKKEEEGTIVFYPFKTSSRISAETGLLPTPFSKSIKREEKTDSWHYAETGNAEKNFTNSTKFLASINSDEGNSQPNLKIEKEENEGNVDLEKFKKMDFSSNYYIPLNKKATKISACAVLLLIMVLSWFIPRPEVDSPEERASVLPIDKVIDSAVGYTNDKPIINKTPDAPLAPETQKTEYSIIPDSATGKSYYLIVATCTSLPEATKWVDSNKKYGYHLDILESKKLFRVSAFSSSSRQTLVDTMRSEKFRTSFSSSWVWKK
ncbi:MAG: hypothetical protein K2N05_05460 [Muribaculaceae bacterium]|nr:hypothetical protein [Muribaculaceae bacterium]